MTVGQPLKAVVGKIGLDGHYRGIKFVAMVLSQAGAEVVYLGANRTVSDIVGAVMEEDARMVALSFLAPDYRQHVPQLLQELREAGLDDVAVVIGGLVAETDHAAMKEAGVYDIFGPGTTADSITELVRTLESRVQRTT